MNNRELWIQAMRDVQEQIYDLTVQKFQQIKLTAAARETPETIDKINELRWIGAAADVQPTAHNLIHARYKELIDVRNRIADKNTTSLSDSDFLKAYEIAKDYLYKNPGQKIFAIREMRTYISMSLKDGKAITDLIT